MTPLYTLVCKKFSNSSICSNMSIKLAKSLIRIASERIFALPSQSIVELVSNSIDAYRVNGTPIGKFGMGFLSILGWLVGHADRSIVIISSLEDIQITVTITKKEEYYYTLSTVSGNYKPGFSVYINMETTDEEKKSVARELQKFSHLSDVSILLNDIEINSDTEDVIGVVNIVIDKKYISVTDFASGASLDTILNSLLIPSVSTKQITTKTYVPFTLRIKHAQGKTQLDIISGGVSIYSGTSQLQANIVFVIDIGSGSLPVSRDDLLPNSEFRDIGSGSLPVSRDDLLPNSEFRDILVDLAHISVDINVLFALQDLLEGYINYTASLQNKKDVRDALTTIYNEHINNLVPYQLGKYYDIISHNFIMSIKYDPIKLENTLNVIKGARKDIWYGKKVFIVKQRMTNPLVNLGVASYMLLSEAYTNNPQWRETLTVAYITERLLPYNTLAEEERESVISEKKDAILNSDLFYTVVMRFKSLNIYYDNIDEREVERFIGTLNKLIVLGQENWNNIVTAYLSRFARAKGNATYGGSKWTFNAILSFNIEKKASEARRTFITESLISAINAVEETQATHLFQFYRSYYKYSPPIRELLEYLEKVCNTTDVYMSMVLCIRSNIFNPMLVKQYAHYLERRLSQYQTGDISKLLVRGITSFFLEDIIREYKIWEELYSNDTIRYTLIEIPNVRWNDYTSSSIINHVLHHNITRHTKVEDITHNGGDPFSSSLLNIAINEGTTKSAVESSITELVQNSYDALKTSNAPTRSIIINTSKGVVSGKFILSIEDSVGMGLWEFLHLSVPFLSTKNAGGITVGEMGSGFFNVYRQCEFITIETVKNGHRIYSMEKPVYDKDNKVVDIKKRIYVEDKTILSNFTLITIVFEGDYIALSVLAENYIRRVIGTIKDAAIIFNDSLINRSLTKVYSSQFYEIFIDSDPSSHSYIQTNGIPFGTIADYIRASSNVSLLSNGVEGAYGIVINILPGGYTPVHSRTKIINTLGSSQLDEHILKAIAMKYFMYIDAKLRSNTITHFYSTGDSTQLYFMSYDERTPFTNIESLAMYYPIVRDISFSKLINQGIDEYTTQLGELTEQDTIKYDIRLESKGETLYEPLVDIIEDMVKEWFDNKNTNKNDNTLNNESSVNEFVARDNFKALKRVIKEFLKRWISLGVGTITGFNEGMLNKIIFVTDDKRSGWVDIGTRNLYINVGALSDAFIDSIPHLVLIWDLEIPINEKLDRLNKNEVWNTMFTLKYPSSLLVHEMEHLRRNESGHDMWIYPLWIGDLPYSRTFEDSANNVYIKLLEMGLMK